METIESAKKSLEKKIIQIPSVIGIGVILWDGTQFIEVAVKDAQGMVDLSNMLPDSKWEGYPVKIIIREQNKVI